MLVSNLSTNVFVFTGYWPDGSSQSLTLGPGASVKVPGFSAPGLTNTYWDGYTAMWAVVNDDHTGLGVHGDYTASSFIMSGFWWSMPMILVMMIVWGSVKGFRLQVPKMD